MNDSQSRCEERRHLLAMPDPGISPAASQSDVPVDHMTHRLRILFTISIFLGYTAFGFACSLTGPALLDLATLTNSSFEDVSTGLVVKTLANGSGGVLIGWLFRYVDRQVGVIVCLTGCAILMPLIPFTRSLETYLVCEGLLGLLNGGIDCASHSWLMDLWPSSGAMMQTLHFAFSVGLVMGPLIEAPFLSSAVVTDSRVTQTESRVHIPYAISSILFMVASGFAIYMRCCHPRFQAKERITESTRAPESGTSLADTDKKYTKTNSILISMKVLAILLFFSYAVSEMNLLSFISSYAVYSDLKLSRATGALLASVLSASYTVFRGMSAVVSSRVRTTTMLYACVSMIAVGNVVLVFWGSSYVTGLWVSVIILGAGHSSINALLYSFLKERMEMTSLVCGLCMMSATMGCMISAAIVGRLLESYPPVFGLVNIAGLAAVVTLLAVFYCLEGRGKRGSSSSFPVTSIRL